MNSSVRFALLAASALLAAACGGSEPAPVPTAIVLSTTAVTFDAIGATQTVTATVNDQKGNAMQNIPVTWTSSGANATVTPLTGASLTLPTATVASALNGTATITATAGAAHMSLTVTTTQIPTAILKQSGDLQTGTVNQPLTQPVAVKVTDRLGAPVAQQSVTFTVTQGGGALTQATITSGADGIAAATWTMGKNSALTQQVVATLGTLSSVSFVATANAGAPATLNILAGNNQTVGVSAAVSIKPSVRVFDAFSNPVAGVVVTFAVTAGGGTVTGGTQTTDVNGIATVGSWTMGSVSGTNTLSVSTNASGVTPISFTATSTTAPIATQIAVSAGNNQAVYAGQPVTTRPAVIVKDAAGNGVSGVPVTFAVVLGGGTITGATQTTNASGIATLGGWTIGATPAFNTLTATATGLTGSPITFSVAGCENGGAGFRINVCYRSTMTASQRQAFVDAATRWSTIITTDQPDVSITFNPGECGSGLPGFSGVIDDLMIFAAVNHIDGTGNVLGSARFCGIRDDAPNLPFVGSMQFDEDDLPGLESQGLLAPVILHEMGHVLGIGSIWEFKGLLVNKSPGQSSTTDTFFSGPQAIAGFNVIGGTTYTGGQKVPVENIGGSGTANAHWRENVLRNELMTGFVNQGSNPLSVVTIGSLADIGYTVSNGSADPFFLTLSLRLSPFDAPEKGVWLTNDSEDGPRFKADRAGRITRIR